jgi:hypothetical protein
MNAIGSADPSAAPWGVRLLRFPLTRIVALVVCIIAGLLLLIAATRRNHVIQPFWSVSSSQVA